MEELSESAGGSHSFHWNSKVDRQTIDNDGRAVKRYFSPAGEDTNETRGIYCTHRVYTLCVLSTAVVLKRFIFLQFYLCSFREYPAISCDGKVSQCADCRNRQSAFLEIFFFT